MKTLYTLEEAKHILTWNNDNNPQRYKVSKPLGITLWWRIKASWHVLKGHAVPVEWE